MGKKRNLPGKRLTRDAQGNLGFKIWAPERVIERQTGCWNCSHFENGDVAKQYYDRTLRPRQLAIFIEQGASLDQAEKRLQRVLDPMRPPKTGICLVNGATGIDPQTGKEAGADLVHHAFKCEKWSGKMGLRVEGKQDELIGEIKDRMGEGDGSGGSN